MCEYLAHVEIVEDGRGSKWDAEESPLQAFLAARGIPSARVERAGGFNRRQMARWRQPKANIRLRQMIRILRAIRRITGEDIQMHQIFDLEPDHWTD